MKIMIFYASYGGGHLSAARSIKQFIEQNYPGCEVEMVDCMKYINTGIEKMTTGAYKIMAKEVPWAWGQIYKLSDKGPIYHISNFNNKVMSIKLNNLFKEHNPDIVISTHPFSTQMTAWLKQLKKTNCKLASVMTDFMPQNQWLVGHKYIDYIFVSNKEMKKKIIEKGISEDKIHVTGIPLSNRFLENFDREKIKQSFKLDLNKRTILFFGGGEFGLGKDKTLRILESFLDNIGDLYQMVIISGKNEKMYERFSNLISEKSQENNVLLLGYTNQVPELMAISDLVVTKPGGLTITESLASGLPIVAINPIPGQEEENAEFLEKAEVAVWLRKHDEPDDQIAVLLSNPDRLYSMKLKSKLMAKKNSTKNICNIILNNYKKG